jgi:hypothetical protein
MADEHTRAELARLRAELADLRATVSAQQATVAALRPGPHPRRRPRRALPLALAALLVALVPLATLAAGFTDLNPGSPHNGNIAAIAAAGITTGCNPPDYTQYCPNDYVTREQMASFLARTAGLGGNPPVANARNADTVGGYAASALGRVAFSSTRLTDAFPAYSVTDLVQVTLTIPGPAPQSVVVDGSFRVFGQASGGYLGTDLRQDDHQLVGGSTYPYLTNNSDTGINASASWVFVAAPGTHTYTLSAIAFGTAGPLKPGGTRLIATTHPFGGDGSAPAGR